MLSKIISFSFNKLDLLHDLQILSNYYSCSSRRVSTEFELLKLKTCSLYHENLLCQKFNDMITQVLKQFFSASDIMEAVRGRFYGMKVA